MISGGRHTAGTCLNPKPRFPAHVQSHKEEGGEMKTWQEQDPSSSMVVGREVGRRAPVLSLSCLCLIGIRRCFIMQKPLTCEFSVLSQVSQVGSGAGGRYASSHLINCCVFTRLIVGSQPGSMSIKLRVRQGPPTSKAPGLVERGCPGWKTGPDGDALHSGPQSPRDLCPAPAPGSELQPLATQPSLLTLRWTKLFPQK